MDKLIGFMIRRERLNRNYSQESLCKGICAVSYLSKIEQGQVEAREDIIRALLKRLQVHYKNDPEFLAETEEIIDRAYTKIYEMESVAEEIAYLDKHRLDCLSSRCMLDTLLLTAYVKQKENTLLDEYASCMNQRQYELYLYEQCMWGRDKYTELLKLNSNAFYTVSLGVLKCYQGAYQEAIELLTRGCNISCDEGNIRALLNGKVLLGTCYSNLRNNPLMTKHYRAAERIAAALGEQQMIDLIYYNLGATYLDWGMTKEAYECFDRCVERDVLFHHKFAICMEKLGQRLQAMAELMLGYQDALVEESPVYKEMLDVVRYRLEHEDYLHEEDYDELLTACFAHIEEELPEGFALFHVPYLEEVYQATRRYKDAYLLNKKYAR